jgi:hypothetical protein
VKVGAKVILRIASVLDRDEVTFGSSRIKDLLGRTAESESTQLARDPLCEVAFDRAAVRGE